MVPVSRPFPSRFPDSREPVCTRFADAVPRLAQVCKLPLLISAQQSPLAAFPSSTRFPATVSRAVRRTFQVDDGRFPLTALGSALGLISVLLSRDTATCYGMHVTPVSLRLTVLPELTLSGAVEIGRAHV